MNNLNKTTNRSQVLLDTNILIYLMKGEYELSLIQNKYFISRVSYIEFLSFKKITEDKLNFLKDYLYEYFEIIEINSDISDNAAKLGRATKGLKVADSIILATAYTYDFKLLTKDKRLNAYYKKLSAN